MPRNRVLFEIGGDSWTMAGVSLVVALALIASGGILLGVLLMRATGSCSGARRR